MDRMGEWELLTRFRIVNVYTALSPLTIGQFDG
jgi:hypothetical protein